MRASFLWFVSIPAIAGLVVLACSEPPPAKNPDDGELLPLKVSTAKPASEPPPVAATEPSAAPSATASAKAEAPPPPAESSGDGRPPLLKTDPTEVTDTVGVSPGAKFVIGGDQEQAVLRIHENSFTTGVNVTFKSDPKAKAGGLVVGKIYRITVVIPPSATPERIATAGQPFKLQLPAGNKKDANLAIGEVGPAKVTWKVIAPVKIDDATNMAYFELPELYDFYVHVTTRPATAPAAPAGK
jgi:hypothetical protein